MSYLSFRRARSGRVVKVPAGSAAAARMAGRPRVWEEVEGGVTVEEAARPGPVTEQSGDEPGGQAESGPPPQSGPGSGVNAWRTYASGHLDEVPDKKSDIIGALEAAGVDVG